MKKITLILVSVLAFSYAQAQSVKIGLKGGINYSNVNGDLTAQTNHDSKIGFHGGITSNFSLFSDVLSLQPELLYSQKGYNYKNEEFKDDKGIIHESKGKMNFSYLDLPVLLKGNFKGFFVEAGPQLSYLMQVQDKTEVSVNNIEEKDVTNVSKDNLDELEIGYVAGTGYQFKNGMSLGVRYNGTIDGLAKSNSDEITNNRHSVYQFQVGFLLGL